MIVKIKLADGAEAIHKALPQNPKGKRPFNAAKHFDKVRRDIDGLAYQKQVRSEWE